MGRTTEVDVLAGVALGLAAGASAEEVAGVLLEAARGRTGALRGLVVASPDGSSQVLASAGLASTVLRRPGRSGVSPLVREARSGELVAGLDPETEPWLAGLLPGAGRLVAVPLATAERSFGALVVELPPRTRRVRSLLTALDREAGLAALALSRLWELEQVRRLAATDGLTKIANRRTFEVTLERELARAGRSGEHLSLVLLDLDLFKRLNDTQGHQAGDAVLRNVAAALACECRDFDTAARYGGEEFAVVLPGCGPDEAAVIAERLRRSVTSAPGVAPLTASAGVATYPGNGRDAAALVKAADDALYRSKHDGRDRTTVSEAVPDPASPRTGPSRGTPTRITLPRGLAAVGPL